MEIAIEDIAGYYDRHGRLCCAYCMDESEIEDADSILTQEEVDKGNKIFFCDIHGKRIE
jgi:hypothetical protein